MQPVCSHTVPGNVSLVKWLDRHSYSFLCDCDGFLFRVEQCAFLFGKAAGCCVPHAKFALSACDRPSFVKIGQALSARPDLLPKVYLESLSELQDRLPSFPQKIALSMIEEELGRPADEIFAEISAEPVAAASLGQVWLPTVLECWCWGRCAGSSKQPCHQCAVQIA